MSNTTDTPDYGQIRVHLGTKFGLDDRVTITHKLPISLAEVDPEEIFSALQRVGDMSEASLTENLTPHDHRAADYVRLTRDDTELTTLLRGLRLELDMKRAPSMSTEDFFDIISPTGRLLVTYEVAMMGFKTIAPAERV